ncbi:hypothetical protein E5Q_02566 [Mixia osmundae IAM 14324]|uniref:Uncharacterized protein n=1 Tax=Mixia osmundae (strain CBS 9802 / IAM 14324 / JCM 22182 / KY 12970) TaxID=764103 RepID=G7DZ98_MIXOS|nr:hypothetical protein E5Q_02566 [Mixia osmundae IAM 14324]
MPKCTMARRQQRHGRTRSSMKRSHGLYLLLSIEE